MGKRNSNLEDARTDQAIEALLNSKSLNDAAGKAEIPYTSMRRLLRNPDFQKALREARTEVMDAALTRLRGLCENAVETVAQTLEGKNTDHLKYNAAKWVVEHGIAGLQIDVDDRIRKLEEAAQS